MGIDADRGARFATAAGNLFLGVVITGTLSGVLHAAIRAGASAPRPWWPRRTGAAGLGVRGIPEVKAQAEDYRDDVASQAVTAPPVTWLIQAR
ncbi:hypothetical protein HDA45_000127 [Amycolatopsis umgeniensis]|uniref:Uncharacterized protein n=1 Tax=Amycolatopsis umgeniensis TaxID=336628 RepID=A0A841AU74_9PSEU|nr:hypothetical protein [Amycolatopsis umgeniensis]